MTFLFGRAVKERNQILYKKKQASQRKSEANERTAAEQNENEKILRTKNVLYLLKFKVSRTLSY